MTSRDFPFVRKIEIPISSCKMCCCPRDRIGFWLLHCQLSEAFTDNLLSGWVDSAVSPGSSVEHDCSASRDQLSLSGLRC